MTNGKGKEGKGINQEKSHRGNQEPWNGDILDLGRSLFMSICKLRSVKSQVTSKARQPRSVCGWRDTYKMQRERAAEAKGAVVCFDLVLDMVLELFRGKEMGGCVVLRKVIPFKNHQS